MFEASWPTLLSLLFNWAIGLVLLYLAVRFAVRHAIEDADKRRAAERPRTW